MKPQGSRAGIDRKSARVVIAPARKRYKLDDLLKGMTPKAMHNAYDGGRSAVAQRFAATLNAFPRGPVDEEKAKRFGFPTANPMYATS